ncbi:EthD family reductase [Flavobacterium cellulosilyticum]|uniref:EthD family reductase n=1 Tax=Flavobacterium cellulosilyticum TaxID=2541731 RepID=A0A4R5CME8_9FLAO|nr:EthD family reductase [Flavobacterium cellulosilyticum]TDD98692.1 EthD family reductase [Flavobacterium cellulosilyticum]
MIKVSVLYPNGPETKFDVDYYKNTHLPMIAQALGDALIGMELNIGLGGRVPGELAPYVAIAHLNFDSIASFKTSFEPHAATFAADVPNYTNVAGELQISEII